MILLISGKDAVPTYEHRVTVWCIRNIKRYWFSGVLCPRLSLSSKTLVAEFVNRFSFYPGYKTTVGVSIRLFILNLQLWLQNSRVIYVLLSQPESWVHGPGPFIVWTCISKCKLLFNVNDRYCCRLLSLRVVFLLRGAT